MLVGDAGKRLHTGRSRNDQVATDIRLYLRDSIDDIMVLLKQFQFGTFDLAEREAATPMPGFTHLQVAQPITFGHHQWPGSMYDAMPNVCRRTQARNQLPLGAAALTGTTYPIDREYVASELGFDGVCASAAAIAPMHEFSPLNSAPPAPC